MIGLLGLFDEPDHMEKAAKESRWIDRDLVRISPAPPHEMEDSPVRYFTITGAILGITAGFGISVFATLKYSLVVSGKPFVLNAAYVIVMFELMVLFATIFSLIAVFVLSIVPNLFVNRMKLPPWHRPDLTHDKWGLYVPCAEAESSDVMNALKSLGARQVERVTES